METIYIRENIWKQFLVLLGAGLLDYLFILGAIGKIYIHKHPIMFQLVSIIGAVFFSVGVILFIVRIINPKPIIILSIKGFIDSSSFISIGFVSWDNVKKIYIDKSTLNLKTSIILELKNKNKLLNQLPHWKKKISKFFMSKYNINFVSFDFSTANISTSKVLEIMQKYKAEYDRLHQANE